MPMDALTAIFRSGAAMCRRNVSAVVQSTVLDLPAPPAALEADWQREISLQMCLEPGDIETLSLARTRFRWPEFGHCIDAVERWIAERDLPQLLNSSDMALMASRGTRYHHDGGQYGGSVFCNVFLSDDSGTDFHFPASGHRIALKRGTAVIFDPCQPHAIIRSGSPGFDAADFASAMRPQVFLTWELPVEHDGIRKALGITLHADPGMSAQDEEERVLRNGLAVALCPATGTWLSPT